MAIRDSVDPPLFHFLDAFRHSKALLSATDRRRLATALENQTW